MIRSFVAILLILFLYPFSSSATVFEFGDNGSVQITKAESFYSKHRQSKFLRSAFGSSSTSAKYNVFVKEASLKYSVDEKLIHAIIKAKSSYNPDAVSPKGAQGLMQLMPETAKAYGVTDSFSPEDNIAGGTKYLKELLDRYDGDLDRSIAAYNAGEGAVDKYNGIPPYSETIKYVQTVTNYLEESEE